MNDQQLKIIRNLSTNQEFNDNVKCFVTFGHFFNDNPAVTLANCYCISGKPSINADALAGVVKRYRDPSTGLGVCAYIRIIELNDEICTIGTRRIDELAYDIPEHTWSFTIQEANKRGLSNNRTWKQMPKIMLHKRCLTALLRAIYSDVIGVSYSPDELIETSNDPDRDRIMIESATGERAPQPSRAPQQQSQPPRRAKIDAEPPTYAEQATHAASSLPDDMPEKPDMISRSSWISSEGGLEAFFGDLKKLVDGAA
jgi:hypothetical protein